MQPWYQSFISAHIDLYSNKQSNNDKIYILFLSFVVSFYTVQYILMDTYVHNMPIIEQIVVLLGTFCLVALTVIAVVLYTVRLERGGQLRFIVALLVLSLITAQYVQQQSVEAQISAYPGAAAIYYDITPRETEHFYQTYDEVLMDRPSFYQYDECQAMYLVEVRKCSYGVLNEPDYVIAVVAGSHSAHWFPALEPLAQELNFRLDMYNHDGCRFTDADPDGHLTEQCIDWNANLLEVLKKDPPSLVFTTASLNKRDHVPEGFASQWEKLEGISTIFAIRDTPRMDEHVPECLARTNGDVDACSMPRDEALSRVAPWENTPKLPSNVIYADLSDYFCDDTTCYPVIGNMMIYRDQHHLTASYVKTLVPVMRPIIKKALSTTDKRLYR